MSSRCETHPVYLGSRGKRSLWQQTNVTQSSSVSNTLSPSVSLASHDVLLRFSESLGPTEMKNQFTDIEDTGWVMKWRGDREWERDPSSFRSSGRQ